MQKIINSKEVRFLHFFTSNKFMMLDLKILC